MNPQETDFKDKIKSFIPRIEEMLIKEMEHRDWLKKQRKGGVRRQMFIMKAELIIEQLNYSLEQYKNYVNG